MQQIKKLIFFFLFTLFNIVSLQAQVGQLQLSGKLLSETSSDYVYLSRFDNKIFTVIDSAKLKDREFSFRTSLELPDLYGISVDKEATPYYIFLGEGEITVDLIVPEYYRGTQVKGSESHRVFEEYRTQKNPDIQEFIIKYPDQVSSAYILYREWSYRLEPDTLEELIELFTPSLQQSRFITSLQEIIATTRKVSIGNKAPKIIAKDTTGNEVELYDQLSKYTLIEFWASWCSPCRLENPNLVANYHQYKDAGLSIYAISLDKNRTSWVKAIKDDGLDWIHVSELGFWKSSIADSYAVRAIPANFLVDENGIIVAKNLKGNELSETLKRLFETDEQ